MLFSCHCSSNLKDFVQPLEFFSAKLAALAHDINHKGVNNLYKIKKKANKALLYCEHAVLENMHASTYFRILTTNPDIDISKFLQPD